MAQQPLSIMVQQRVYLLLFILAVSIVYVLPIGSFLLCQPERPTWANDGVARGDS